MLKLQFYDTLAYVREHIKLCQRKNHKQQVAYTTYHDALTQLCFTCKSVRTSLIQLHHDDD